jgi:signal transduction histidine kinase/CheY-like chemotaxis protein
MIESCPDGLALLSEDGVVLEHNGAMVRIFERAEDLLIDQTFSALVGSSMRDPSVRSPFSVEHLSRAIAGPQTLLVALHRSIVEFRISGWVEEERAYFVVSARPMETRDQRERELLQARQEIQALDAALEEQRRQDEIARLDSLSLLASTMVHDLNNALAVVLLNIELLREELGPGSHIELLDDARSGTSRVQELVTRLRSFSLGPSLIFRQLCVATWLPEFLRPIVAGQRAELELDVGSQKHWISADENQLAQVLLNLITNATQAAVSAGVKPRITVRLSGSPNGFLSGAVVRHVSEIGVPHLILTIEDNGLGIPADGFRRLFVPFHTSKSTGTGLGLASVARITSLHRGGIAVDNIEGGGARFTLALPTIQVCSSPADSAASSDSDPQADPDLTGIEVITMEDDPRVRDGIERVLADQGASVTCVANGEQLLEAYATARARGSRPVCVLDIHVVSGMSGLVAVQRLRERWPDVTAMACTGHAEVESTDQFSVIGFKDWIFKPFRPEDLRRAVWRLASDSNRD